MKIIPAHLPSQPTAHRSVRVKPAKLHTVHWSLAVYTLVLAGCQTCLWAHVPQGPVHPLEASNDGAQLPWAVFHQRAGKPPRHSCLAPESSWHGSALGRVSMPSTGCRVALALNQCFLDFMNSLSLETCILMSLLWAIFYHQRSGLSQPFTIVDVGQGTVKLWEVCRCPWKKQSLVVIRGMVSLSDRSGALSSEITTNPDRS